MKRVRECEEGGKRRKGGKVRFDDEELPLLRYESSI